MEEAQLGTTIIAGISITLSIVIFILYLGVRERKKFLHQEAELERIENEKQREILKAVLRTEEQERVRIARDLHDALGTTMGALRAELASRASRTKDERFEKMLGQITQIDEQIRSALYRIYPVRLERYGLNAMLSQSLEGWRDTLNLQTTFSSEVPDEIFGTRESKLNILRIVEELMNNTIKHGKCKRIELLIEKKNPVILITLSHDGIPFNGNPQSSAGVEGIGLESINSRLDFLKGNISYLAGNKEQKVVIELPIEN